MALGDTSQKMKYGGRLFGTDMMMGANTERYGNARLNGQIGNNLAGLLQGNNPAANQADRTNLTALSQLQKNQNAGAQRNAVQMGIRPGDPRFAALNARNNSELQTMGSRLLGDAQQRRLEDQTRNLQTAIGYNRDQQSFGLDAERFNEDTRRFDKDFTAREKQNEVNSLFDIINNPYSSGGEVEAAKNRLFATQGGLDPNLLGKKDLGQGAQARQELDEWVRSAFPGKTEAEYQDMINKRMGDFDTSQYGTLSEANKMNVPAATAAANPAGGGKSPGLGDRVLGANEAISAPVTGITQGAGHVVGEVGRGFRDISEGDVLGGAGRVLTAPVKGGAHAVMQTGRAATRGLRKLFGGG